MRGTWNFYSIFGGADAARGLLLPSSRPVFPTTEVILNECFFLSKPASHLLAVPHAVCHRAASTASQTHRDGREGLVGEPDHAASFCPFLPFLLLQFPCFLLPASMVDSQRHLTNLNSANTYLTTSLGCPDIWWPAFKTPAKITETLVFKSHYF